jgi:hypothetical protein
MAQNWHIWTRHKDLSSRSRVTVQYIAAAGLKKVHEDRNRSPKVIIELSYVLNKTAVTSEHIFVFDW